MKLLIDDLNRVYVWVDSNTNEVLSPHFDYEDDADNWYFKIKNNIEFKVVSVEDITKRSLNG